MNYNIIRYRRNIKGLLVLAIVALTAWLAHGTAAAQEKVVNPSISYAGTPRLCEIAGLAVDGVEVNT